MSISVAQAQTANYLADFSIGDACMMRDDLAPSGVFAIDMESGLPYVVLLNGAYGRRKNIVQGAVS